MAQKCITTWEKEDKKFQQLSWDKFETNERKNTTHGCNVITNHVDTKWNCHPADRDDCNVTSSDSYYGLLK